MSLKQNTPVEKAIGDYIYYIRPFSAMISTKLSGDVTALIMPILSGAVPMLASIAGNDDEKGLFDLDINFADAAPALANTFSTLDGNKVEKLIKSLILDNGNISYSAAGDNSVKRITTDEFNEIFCCELQDMYMLAYEVIKLNFGGFFKKFSSLYGKASVLLKKAESKNTEASTQQNSQSLS